MKPDVGNTGFSVSPVQLGIRLL